MQIFLILFFHLVVNLTFAVEETVTKARVVVAAAVVAAAVVAATVVAATVESFTGVVGAADVSVLFVSFWQSINTIKLASKNFLESMIILKTMVYTVIPSIFSPTFFFSVFQYTCNRSQIEHRTNLKLTIDKKKFRFRIISISGRTSIELQTK